MRKPTNAICRRALLATLFVIVSGGAAAQEPQTPSGEIETGQAAFKLRTERNVVVVRVIVRDPNGNPVTGLHQEDFQIIDNGKPQVITGFTVKSPKVVPGGAPAKSPSRKPSAAGTEGEHPEMPDRFVALFFNDVHLSFEDAIRTREAAEKYLSESLQATDRVAVFTSSGHLSQDFTADRDKLNQVLVRLNPRPFLHGKAPCMGASVLTPYQAYVIKEHDDPQGYELASGGECGLGSSVAAVAPSSESEVRSAVSTDLRGCPPKIRFKILACANQVLEADEFQSKETMDGLEAVVRRLAHMPGQRSIVWISPGFISEQLQCQFSDLANRALRSNVVISALNSKGLYAVIPGGDAATGSLTGSGGLLRLKVMFERANDLSSSDTLAELARATGGNYFENSNDYLAGFRRTGGLPEAAYVLTFSPENLKYDGSFHKLEVALMKSSKLTIQARRGYFAPRKSEDLAARAKEDLDEAVFSRDEMRELPLDIRTSLYKTDELNARLRVLARVRVNSVPFRTERDRHRDDLKLVAALFDNDGNYVVGSEATYKLRLRDARYTQAQRDGIIMRTTMNVVAGTYLMRIVVRDSDSGQISATNKTVKIPY